MTKRRSPSETKPRRPQRRRVAKADLPSFRLTARDIKILRAVYACRALTSHQIQRLFFPSRSGKRRKTISSRCLHRLKLLFHAAFLQRSEQPQLLAQGRKPFVYHLDRRGAELLAHLDEVPMQELDWHPNDYQVGHLFLDHLLATNDVRVALMLAAQEHGFTIDTWLDEKALKSPQMKDRVTLVGPQGGEQSAAVVPDGYFLLYTGNHYYHQFLEVDRRTVTGSSATWGRRTWARKVRAFLAYYRSGQYHERYHTKSMRVLTVTTGERRLANLKTITEDVGGKARFWFTTFDEIEDADILTDPIWQVAGKEEKRTLVW